MDDVAFQVFWAPLAVGAILWLLAEAVRSLLVTPVARRRARRRRIVSLMGRAESLIIRAVRDDLYEIAWLNRSTRPLDEMRAQYDELTAEALDLFVEGEEDVAFWTAVEFYAGYRDPTITLEKAGGEPRRRRPDGQPRLPAHGDWFGPRSDMLIDWANRWAPWAGGNAKAPSFGDRTTGKGDQFRHDVVTPNSEVPPGMLLPFIWRVRDRHTLPHEVRSQQLEPRGPRSLESGL